ncbi:outer membrane beta-barrel protein [Tenacibaculum finnmarkense]|uniref:outer membrane beta-barrel protein n=1 Tax=Tenacibaculum finnmarkense TaxID=2781243 RepID=UPI001E53A110|nr:outer membrane beta-barrel protein [Tenacibaculum finnmarkense]MCD8408848.1 outer membrane beta-barrel protein [Tenacibaculum finnmarkense genomovar ulcerans]
MKKLQITIILLFVGIVANAQFKIGGKLAYGTEIKSLGLGVKATYPINDKLTASGELNYFFESDESSENTMGSYSFGGYSNSVTNDRSTKLITFNTDLHYSLPFSSFDFYAIGGVNFSNVSIESSSSGGGMSSTPFSNSETFVGLNLGIGGFIPINNDLDFFSELKYIASDFNQLVFSAGVLYRIN